MPEYQSVCDKTCLWTKLHAVYCELFAGVVTALTMTAGI